MNQITKERIRAIEIKALSKLKHPQRSKRLKKAEPKMTSFVEQECLPELPFESQLKCRLCGFKTKGFKGHITAIQEMSWHLVDCLRMWETH